MILQQLGDGVEFIFEGILPSCLLTGDGLHSVRALPPIIGGRITVLPCLFRFNHFSLIWVDVPLSRFHNP